MSLSRPRGRPQKLLVEEAAHARDNTTFSISDRVAATTAARWPPKNVHQAGGARPCVAKAFHVLMFRMSVCSSANYVLQNVHPCCYLFYYRIVCVCLEMKDGQRRQAASQLWEPARIEKCDTRRRFNPQYSRQEPHCSVPSYAHNAVPVSRQFVNHPQVAGKSGVPCNLP